MFAIDFSNNSQSFHFATKAYSFSNIVRMFVVILKIRQKQNKLTKQIKAYKSVKKVNITQKVTLV